MKQEVLQNIDYASTKYGLAALDSFVANMSSFHCLVPFTLPVRWRNHGTNKYEVTYYLGSQTGVKRNFYFYLSEDQIACLGDTIFVIPQQEITRGTNPYYWLNFYATTEPMFQSLTSCRLQPENGVYKFNFRTWHGLEEQLLTDYILGRNDLNFNDLLPLNFSVSRQSGEQYYDLGCESSLKITIVNKDLQKGDTLKGIPQTDDQKVYEWLDIFKTDPSLSEERWPLVCSYRILNEEHRIYSTGWFGSERELLIDRMRGKNGIGFENLRSIIASATVEGRCVYLFDSKAVGLEAKFSVPPGLLVQGERTISIPRRDNQGIYEWLDLYRFNSQINEPTAEVIASTRITSDGTKQKGWLGEEKQLLKDYIDGIVKFSQLKTLSLKSNKRKKMNRIDLWGANDNRVSFKLSVKLGLKPDDNLTLVPERETEDGTDFLLIKDGTTLVRYRLNCETKKFSCIDILVEQQSSEKISVGDVSLLQEYTNLLLSGQIMSFEEFMDIKEQQHD